MDLFYVLVVWVSSKGTTRACCLGRIAASRVRALESYIFSSFLEPQTEACDECGAQYDVFSLEYGLESVK